MTELNKTDANSLALIESLISDLQVYVEVNICDGNTMTAAAIYKGFKEDVGCELDEDDFVKGFRVAVRAGRITGIESAKRLGYRKIGDTAKTHSANDDAMDIIEPYLEGIQKFVSARIRGEVRMTAAVIYKKFKAEVGCELSEDDFIKSFRLAIREGKITGLESAYRFGYKEAGVGVTKSDEGDDEEEKIGHDICEIVIDERRKLVALDRLNWALQVRRDTGTWVTEAYIPNMSSGLQILAKRLLDDELKGMNRFLLQDFVTHIHEAEKRITELLMKHLPVREQKEKAA